MCPRHGPVTAIRTSKYEQFHFLKDMQMVPEAVHAFIVATGGPDAYLAVGPVPAEAARLAFQLQVTRPTDRKLMEGFGMIALALTWSPLSLDSIEANAGLLEK